MKKYEVFIYKTFESIEEDYEGFVEAFATGRIISTDASKASLCKKLGLDDPYWLDVCSLGEGVLYVQYEGRPFCELHEVD